MQAQFTTFTGPEYLAIDIANHFGLDKKQFHTRLEWFEQHKQCLELMIAKADEPALYHGAVQAYRQYERGEAIGWKVGFDATSSGLQLLAVLTGDRRAAELCNVIPVYDEHGRAIRMDAYTAVYKAMLEVVGTESRVKRDDCKQAIMTSLYGSEAIPKEVFGEGPLLTVFYDTMRKLAPAAWACNECFLDIWDSEATEYNWVLPDGFHVRTKVKHTITERAHFMGQPIDITRVVIGPKERGRSLGANSIHSIDGMVVREMVARCMHDPAKVRKIRQWISYDSPPTEVSEDGEALLRLLQLYEESGFLSARVIDLLTQENTPLLGQHKTAVLELLNSLPCKPFELVCVHDCFQCLPHYVNDLRLQYNNQLHLIGKSNMLNFMFRQLLDDPSFNVPPNDPTMFDEILKTEYALS